MFTLTVKINIKKDAWNWWHACNRISHGIDWKQRIDSSIRKQIVGKNKKDAFTFLIPYLTNYYSENLDSIAAMQKESQNIFDRKLNEACQLMEKVTQFPLYKNNFIVYLTTFPRCPYDYETGSVWLCCLWPTKCYMGTFLHELLHFQFIHYYTNLPEVKLLTPELFEYLKESLTIILNCEFRTFLCQSDKGYQKHFFLRRKLTQFWETHKDFKDLIIFGAKILRQGN